MAHSHAGVREGASCPASRRQVEEAINENASWARWVATRRFPRTYLWRDELEAAGLEALWRQVEAWLAAEKTYPLRRFATLPVERAALDQHRRLTRSVRRLGNRNACKTCGGSGESRGAECGACYGTGTRSKDWLVVSLDEDTAHDRHGHGDDFALTETIATPTGDEERDEAWAAIERVGNERSRQVLAWTLAGWELRHIGRAYGVTESRASQLLKQARIDLTDALASA